MRWMMWGCQMIDTDALNTFLQDTALLYVNEIAGAVIAITIISLFFYMFKIRILGRIKDVQ
jgi:hypothetical protein